ncbi:DUF6193 family natural product biosynthesis protein [Streptomyces sp. URMC 126]|uniref:DUF6193 family natural product biosynthesis protein n=1 Tax=Streptomyces sp. URMC 126 TaxID=3423401 RepID=UPI003F19A5E1
MDGNDKVEAAWRTMLDSIDERAAVKEPPLRATFDALVREASAQPPLRRLYPWTGMWELHFSRCTEIRFTWDIPYIGVVGEGRYRVEGPLRSSPRVAETDSARAAVAMVVERLPPGCGPAFAGSAAELAAYEAARSHG